MNKGAKVVNNMNDILFGNNNSKVITKLSKRYFKKNKVRQSGCTVGNYPYCFPIYLYPLPLAFNMASPPSSSLYKCRKAARRMAL